MIYHSNSTIDVEINSLIYLIDEKLLGSIHMHYDDLIAVPALDGEFDQRPYRYNAIIAIGGKVEI